MSVRYRCDIHDFEARSKRQMQQHIDHEHPGGAAKDPVGEFRVDGTERTECWRCGYQRPTYESCPECGGSCKPLTKQKQQKEDDS